MADTCASCFYYRGAACHAYFPSTIASVPAWRPVDPTDWCGEGADTASGRSFSNMVNSVPGTGGAGAGYLATSVTSATIASSGSKALTTQLNLAYTPGARVRATSTGSGAWMEGVVTAYDASATGVLTFTSDSSSGSGAHIDWNINLAGQAGATGAGILSTGAFPCSASTAATIVLNAAVLAGSKIILIPTSITAADLMARTSIEAAGAAPSAIYVSARSAGVSFTVITSNGFVTAGTETFDYIIIN